jgi:hypothetical protein
MARVIGRKTIHQVRRQVHHGNVLLAGRKGSGAEFCNVRPKSYGIFIPLRAYNCAPMQAFLNFMTSDTMVFSMPVHNWIIALGGFAVLWLTVLIRDL